MKFTYHLQLLIFMLIAAALSIISIFHQSIRLDESQSLWVSTKSLPAILNYISHDVHVPLYAILLRFWILLFGNSIITARMLSLIFFIITIPVLYTLARESSNDKIAWFTVLLYCLSPFMLWFSAETRMYTLFTFISVTNHLFFLRFFRSSGKSFLGMYLMTSFIGLYTHYFFILQLMCQGMYVVGVNLYVRRRKSMDSEIAPPLPFSLWLAPMIVSFIFFLPWVIYVMKFGGVNNASPHIPPPNLYTVFQVILSFLFGFPAQALQTVIISIWPIAMIIMFLLFTKRKIMPFQSLGYFLLLSIAPIVLVYALSFYRPIFLARYLIFTLPSFLFILSWCLFHLVRKNLGLLYVSSLVLLISLLIYQNVSLTTPVREDYKGAAELLMKEASYHDIIAASAPFTVYPLEYSYQGLAKITTIPEWNRYLYGPIPSFDYTVLYSQMKDFESKYDRLFVVFSYDQGYQTELTNYLNEHYELLEVKEFPPTIEVRIYDVRKNRES